jgi:hypothetical protein
LENGGENNMVKNRSGHIRFHLSTTFVIGILILTTQPASAFLGEAFGGAMQGALLGSLLDGREGARTGAAIGAGVGLLTGIGREAEQRKAQEAAQVRYEQRKQAMEQQRRADEATRWEAEMRQPTDGVPSNLATLGGPQPHEDPELITEIQRSLIKLGYDPGEIDGSLSDKTIASIMRYQSARGLLETGQPSRELLKYMLRNGG